jgi:hypothetical protein
MIRELEPTVMRLSQEGAKNHLALERIQGDRKCREARIEWLSDKGRRQLLHAFVWATANVAGKVYRLNGQHSSTLTLLQSEGVTLPEFVIVLRFECDSLEELAILFDQFDPKESVRNAAERSAVHIPHIEQLHSVSPNKVNKALAGMAWLIERKHGARLFDDDRQQLLYKHPDFVVFGAEFLGRPWLSKPALVAAMFDTFLIDPDYATSFWTLIRDESHSDPQHATRKLAEFLKRSQYVRPTMTSGEPVPDRGWYAKAVHSWNASIEGRGTNLHFAKDAPLPTPRKSLETLASS